MLDPYRMVIINIFASIFLISGLLIYRYIFPRKRISPLILVILFSFLPLISLLRKGTYESGDLTYHIKSAMIFYQSLSEGIILPRWSPTGCNGYGCADFLFLYLLPYYLICFFHILGLSFVASIKLFIAGTFIASGVGMYKWLKEEIGSNAAVVGSLFYLYAPYHLVDMHFRNAIGELACFALLPFAFFFASRWVKTQQNRYAAGIAVTIALLVISHHVQSLGTIPLLMIYLGSTWYASKKRRAITLITYGIPIMTGVLMSAFYWLPILSEKKYIVWGSGGQINLLNVKELLYSPWMGGLLFQGHNGELSFIIGYVQILILVVSILFLLKRKFNRLQTIHLSIFVAIFIFLFFIMTSYSSYLWQHISLLSFFGFSYRLLVFEAFLIAYIAAVAVSQIKQTIIISLLCLGVILSTILNWGNRKMLPLLNDQRIMEDITRENTGVNPVSQPIWVKGDYYYKNGRVKNHIQILKGSASIRELNYKSTIHEYVISVKKPTQFLENTLYFPDWQLSINDKPYAFSYTEKPNPGSIKFNLKPGLYDVVLKFHNPFIQTFSNSISMTTIVTLGIYLSVGKIKRKVNKKSKKTTKRNA